MQKGKKNRESSDPYYDLIDDFGLIISSFQSQYGIRLSKELSGMKWDEFKDLLVGISPDTALGRIVSIRSENRKEVLEHFTQEQHRIRNEWQAKRAKHIAKNTSKKEMDTALEGIKNALLQWAGFEVGKN